MIVAQVRAVAEDIGVDAVKIGMLGSAASDARRSARRSTCCRAGTPIVVDPVMVAESGARLLDEDAQAALVELAAAAGDGRHAEPARGARARRRRRRSTARSSRARVHALGPRRRRGHRRAPRARRSTSFFDGERVRRARRARATPTARRTGRAARTRRALAAHLALGCTPARGRARARKRDRVGGRARRPARDRRRRRARSTCSALPTAARRRLARRHGRRPPARRVT